MWYNHQKHKTVSKPTKCISWYRDISTCKSTEGWRISLTPPKPAAMEGATETLAFLKTSTASGVQGIFDPRKNFKDTQPSVRANNDIKTMVEDPIL